jgi:enoyl-CoA hydratase/carnithine racemase
MGSVPPAPRLGIPPPTVSDASGGFLSVSPRTLALGRISGVSSVELEIDGQVAVVTINRPEVRNAIDGPTAAELAETFRRFEGDGSLFVAVLTGRGGTFCAGADLKAMAEGRGNRVTESGDAPLGISRMLLSKPTIAAVEGYAVAGGLELALWCDLRVAAENAVFGVFSRRWGVPLIDGGTIRLSRLIGHSHALDMILTGRPVSGQEALRLGLANRLVPAGTTLDAAVTLAKTVAAFPQQCLRGDRLSSYEQWGLELLDALSAETRRGLRTLRAGEAVAGAERFSKGEGRHGSFDT